MTGAFPVNRDDVEQLVRTVVLEQLGRRGVSPAPMLAVHVSARHVHLCQEDLERLFGRGHELTVDRPLYQPGNFAAKEMVSIVGPRNRILSNLRVLGPLRSKSQVELAFTDAISLGLTLPIRLSGDLDGTPGCYMMGPRGMIELKEGVIRAAIHVHMCPEEAAFYGVKHRDIMRLRVGGQAGLTFDNVHVRVNPGMRLNVHMDTDEANACGLHVADKLELIR